MDVLLLAAVFEILRIKFVNSFGLDPAHYYLLLVIAETQCEGLI